MKDSTEESTGWAFVGQIGTYLSQTQPDFDTRSYGYAKLSSMLKALGGLQFRHDDASRMYCRKIPYSELIKLLNNDALPKFQNKEGWVKIPALENTSRRAGRTRNTVLPALWRSWKPSTIWRFRAIACA